MSDSRPRTQCGSHDGLTCDILQSVILHSGQNPVNRILERLRTGKTWTKRVGEVCQAIKCSTVGQRRVDQTVCVNAVLSRKWTTLSQDLPRGWHKK